jgi:hypothetical protein
MVMEQNNLDRNNLENNELTLKELILIVKKCLIFLQSKLKTILIFVVLGFFFGLTIEWFVKPTYKAKLTFAMEEEKGGGGGGLSGALGLASSFGIDFGGAGGGGAFALSNLSELMKSRLIVEKVLLKPINIGDRITTLADYYIEINELKYKWRKNPNLMNIKFLPNADRLKFSIQQDSVLKLFHKNLIEKENLSIMQKDKKVTILSIEVNSSNEIFSKLF